MSYYQIIKNAIQNRQCVTCRYNGHVRKMSPHVIGTKNGIQQALFYQYGGTSSSGLSEDPTKNWRCIPINKISALSTNNDRFQTAHNHSRRQTCVDNIDEEINY